MNDLPGRLLWPMRLLPLYLPATVLNSLILLALTALPILNSLILLLMKLSLVLARLILLFIILIATRQGMTA